MLDVSTIVDFVLLFAKKGRRYDAWHIKAQVWLLQ